MVIHLLTADTDDEIDIKVGGTDRSTIKTTGFHNVDSYKFVAGDGDDLEIYHDGTNSFVANKTGALKIATETSGIAITLGHTTSEVTIADNATVTGNLTVTGTLTQTGTQTFDGGIDVDNFNINGTTIALSSGDMLLDSAGDIILDADGADVIFKDAGTTIATHSNSSSDYVITTGVQDKDFVIKGDDGGSAITPFTLDMSAGGDLFLTGGLIDLKNDGSAVSQIKFYCESSNAHAQTLIGAPHAQSATNTLTLPDGSNGVLLSTVSTATVTNKTFTSPKINEDVAVTSTATELNFNDGVTLGTAIASKVVTTDANIDTTGQRNLTISGELDAATGDFSGNVDIDGTLEADAITVNGTALASVIAGTTVNLATLASTVTITDNENTDENNAIIFTAGGDVDGGSLGLESDGDLTYNPSTGTLNVTNISVTGTQTIVNSVTMNASNAVIFEGATADAHETTLSTVDATADRTINLPNQSGTLPVLAAASATAITSTPEELNLIDGGTSRGTTAVATGDGILINDGGTMRMTNVDTVSTYFSSHNVGGGNIVTTGALNSGTITSGFGTIDTGSSKHYYYRRWCLWFTRH